ncbi:hypothetical protein COLO4_20486 [Corchorus olitorius]|uniref:Uncharacterized protein n=1 Tax=Corchorus olitorius TaxID=93759 RepID=A0A1R3IZR0_9ROSI|nr:hypothetical protein COLO4_20486 [Corchorus olitorius]
MGVGGLHQHATHGRMGTMEHEGARWGGEAQWADTLRIFFDSPT